MDIIGALVYPLQYRYNRSVVLTYSGGRRVKERDGSAIIVVVSTTGGSVAVRRGYPRRGRTSTIADKYELSASATTFGSKSGSIKDGRGRQLRIRTSSQSLERSTCWPSISSIAIGGKVEKGVVSCWLPSFLFAFQIITARRYFAVEKEMVCLQSSRSRGIVV